MMQISIQYLLRITFMLSTIVTVTDCCSSRILFLKEQTFNMIQQHKMQQYQQLNNNGREQTNEKYEQYLYDGNYGMDKLGNNDSHRTNIKNVDETTSGDQLSEAAIKDKPPPSQTGGGSAGAAIAFPDFGKQLSDLLLTDAAKQTKKQHKDQPGYQLIDIYQSIMDNVLSFACTGQFLTDFCLNGGRCFRVPMGNQSLFSCECADGYVGERCESKSVNGVFVPSTSLDHRKPKILTARIVFSFPMLIFLTVIYLFFGMAIVFKFQSPFRTLYGSYAPPQLLSYSSSSSSNSRAAGLLLT